MRSINRSRPAEFTTSSSADIAFLLLSYFLMTTVIDLDKGLPLVLPEWHDSPVTATKNERNVLNIRINGADRLMVEGNEMASVDGLATKVKEFVMNNGAQKNLSDSPKDAIVSLKTDRSTSHRKFIEVLDAVQGAYYEIYAARVGLPVERYRSLDVTKPNDRKIIDRAKLDLPMNISIAEPVATTTSADPAHVIGK